MNLIMDGLLLSAAAFAGIYCHVLARRLRALKNLDAGIGGAIVRMTKALDEARRAIEEAKGSNRDAHRDLKDLVTRAEAASGQLRILLAATRDLPETMPQPARRNRPDEDDPQEDRRTAAVAERAPAPEAPPAGLHRVSAVKALGQAIEAPSFTMPEAGPPTLRAALPKPSKAAAEASEADVLAALAEFAESGRL